MGGIVEVIYFGPYSGDNIKSLRRRQIRKNAVILERQNQNLCLNIRHIIGLCLFAQCFAERNFGDHPK